LGADRATIFLMNNDKTQLSLVMAEGGKEVTVPVGVGIAGTVADTGSNINIPDCYEDRYEDSSLLLVLLPLFVFFRFIHLCTSFRSSYPHLSSLLRLSSTTVVSTQVSTRKPGTKPTTCSALLSKTVRSATCLNLFVSSISLFCVV